MTSPFKHILKEWTVFLRALIGFSTSGYPVLITVSPPVPPSEPRQTRVSYEQNAWLPSVCFHNKPKKSHTKIKQAVPEIHEEGDEIRCGSFNR